METTRVSPDRTIAEPLSGFETVVVTTEGAIVAPQGLPGRAVLRRISWAAVFGGVALAVGVQILLSLLGIGLGVSALHPAGGPNPDPTNFGMAAAAWWGISALLALLAGGFVAGRLSTVARRMDGALHGLLAWAVVMIISVGLVTTALGGLIGGAINAAGMGAGTLQQMDPDLAAAGNLLAPHTDPHQLTDAQAEADIATNLARLTAGGPGAAAAHDRIVAVMAAQLNISQDDANQRLQSITDHAQAMAEAAGRAATRAAIIGFVALLLGAGVAALGGSLGTKPPQQI